jgi:hypothetical protein
VENEMSKTPLLLIAGLLAATFACAAACAQTAPLANANCKDGRLDQVVDGNVVSSEPVVVCKHPKAIAFNAGPERECAMLTCPTFILTGVGD